MGIQTTQYVSRQFCIDRIYKIKALVLDQNWKGIEEITQENSRLDFEVVFSLQDLFTRGVPDYSKYSDAMLEDLMDHPYIRESYFDNYIINGD